MAKSNDFTLIIKLY